MLKIEFDDDKQPTFKEVLLQQYDFMNKSHPLDPVALETLAELIYLIGDAEVVRYVDLNDEL